MRKNWSGTSSPNRCCTLSAGVPARWRKDGGAVSRTRLCHILDQGGLRRATLRGCEKLTKRHMIGAMTYNLGLLMRTLFGIGTPKQAMAGGRGWPLGANDWHLQVVRRLICHFEAFLRLFGGYFFLVTKNHPRPPVKWGFSTGC